MPKFHDRLSLVIGTVAGIVLAMLGWAVAAGRIIPSRQWLVGLFIAVIGGVLAFHCLDMLRYWKKHRIVKIVKTDTERIVYKEEK